MKRRYIVSVAVVAEFERKATGTAKEAKARMIAAAESMGGPWTVGKTSIVSTAKPATPPPSAPSPRQQQVEAQLIKLRGIVDDLATILGNVKTPRLHLYPNRWCNVYPTNGAHAHSKGRRKGLICINMKEVIRTSRFRSGGVPDPNGMHSRGVTDPVWLMAHELTHVRLPAGSHNRQRFKAAERDLADKYHAWRAGTWQPSVRTPGWAKAKSQETNTSQAQEE